MNKDKQREIKDISWDDVFKAYWLKELNIKRERIRRRLEEEIRNKK